MQVKAKCNEENKDKEIKINFSLLKEYINELFESKVSGAVGINYIKDEGGIFYTLYNETNAKKFILLEIQPAFPNQDCPATFHVKEFGDERKYHYIIQEYFILDKYSKWEQGDILIIDVKTEEPISTSRNSLIRTGFGGISNISLQEREMIK